MKTCTCNDSTNLQVTSDIGSAVQWLDARNQARTTYLARLMRGRSLTENNGIKLARTINELKALSNSQLTGSSSSIILLTKDSLIDFASSSNRVASTPLGELDQKGLEAFVAQVEFADYLQDGTRYRHLKTLYFGNLVKEYEMSDDKIFDLMGLFGFADELTLLSYHRFGCNVHPRSDCQPRMYFQCPWFANC